MEAVITEWEARSESEQSPILMIKIWLSFCLNVQEYLLCLLNSLLLSLLPSFIIISFLNIKATQHICKKKTNIHCVYVYTNNAFMVQSMLGGHYIESNIQMKWAVDDNRQQPFVCAGCPQDILNVARLHCCKSVVQPKKFNLVLLLLIGVWGWWSQVLDLCIQHATTVFTQFCTQWLYPLLASPRVLSVYLLLLMAHDYTQYTFSQLQTPPAAKLPG